MVSPGDATALDFDWIDDRLAVGGSFPMEAASSSRAARASAPWWTCDSSAATTRRFLRINGMEFLHLPTEDCCAIAPRMIDDGVAWVRSRLDAGARVLIHCEHGIGRSALLALCTLVAGGT
jgi:protein-tyrosine phosphatase